MDADRFDTLLRSLATSPSRRGALRLLAGSALGSLLMLDPLSTDAKKKGGGKKGGKKAKKCKGKAKVTICHKGQTIQVSRCAVKAHKRHGDKVGACESPPTCMGLNGACTADGQCCSRFCGDGTCQTAGSCRVQGQICNDDDSDTNNDCCTGECLDGTCRPAGSCKEIGVECNAEGDCCSGFCGDGNCHPAACTEQGDVCTGTAPACCGGVCNAGGSNIDGTADKCAECQTGGATCNLGIHEINRCCAGRTCIDAGEAGVCCSFVGEGCEATATSLGTCCATGNPTGTICGTVTTGSAGFCCVSSGNDAPSGCPSDEDPACCSGHCSDVTGKCNF